MSYKKNLAGNRDALFGGSSSGDGGGGGGGGGSSGSGSISNKGYSYGGGNKRPAGRATKPTKPVLSGQAKEDKMKEAQKYREKANKCMQQGLFKKADPVAASTFFRRSAEAYQQCGEYRLEFLMRTSSADSQMMIGTYATAAAEYTRAAELILETTMASDARQSVEDQRDEASKFHSKAAEAWKCMGEMSKSAESMIASATAWIPPEDEEDDNDNKVLSKRVLTLLEEAVEAHVPDVLNPYGKYRQTGISAFIDPNNEEETVSNPSEQSIQTAKANLVSRAYSHEALWKVVYLLAQYNEYASSLYTTGAIATILEKDGISTLSLSKTYVVETIMILAMGDPIGAEQQFLNRHVQKSFYLTSRECKLAEDLFRAIKCRDIDMLNEARDPQQGSNKTAIANLHESVRVIVQQLRVSGVARKLTTTSTTEPSSTTRETTTTTDSSSLDQFESKDMGFSQQQEAQAAAAAAASNNDDNDNDDDKDLFDTDALQAELDELHFGSDEELDDDDVDLR